MQLFLDRNKNPVHNPQGKTRELSGVDETPEEIPSAATEIADQKVLGETPEAVKPCLEEYEQDKGTLMPRHSPLLWRIPRRKKLC